MNPTNATTSDALPQEVDAGEVNGSETPSSLQDNATSLPIDFVAVGGADAAPLINAAEASGAVLYPGGSVESAIERAAVAANDAVIFAGSAAALVGNGWVERTRAAAPDTPIGAYLTEGSSVDDIGLLVRQGVDLISTASDTSERLSEGLGWLRRKSDKTRPARHLRAKHRANLAKLNDGELAVLRAMMDGLANRRVAERLGIGLRTVELRRARMMKKLDATGAAQLVRHFYEAGGTLETV